MFLFVFTSLVSALEPSQASKWIKGKSTSEQSSKILNSYTGLSTPFVDGLLKWTKGQLSKSAYSALNNFKQGNCAEGAFFKVVDGRRILEEPTKRELAFTDSLFLIETSYCMYNTTLQEAYEVYMSPEFRMTAMPRVSQFENTSDGFCTKSDAVPGLILNLEYCSQNNVYQTADSIIVHNDLKSRKAGESFQPMYYREEVLVFQIIPNGVGLYRATFTRSSDIGATGKYILRNTVQSNQDSIRDQYQEWLNR